MGNGVWQNGGAIYNNNGQVNIAYTTFYDNVGYIGGAIANFNNGVVNILGSSFHDNLGAAAGGALYNRQAIMNIANTTFYENTSDRGSAIYNESDNGSIINLTNSVLTRNRIFSPPIPYTGGAFSNSKTATLRNTILYNNLTPYTPGGNCDGTFTDGGGNLFYLDNAPASSGCTGVSTAIIANPLLLEYTGTPGHLPLAVNSPARDAVPANNCKYLSTGANPLFSNGEAILVDGRGKQRPFGAACDIGAYEFRLPAIPANLTATANGQFQIDLAWNAADDAITYRIEKQNEAAWDTLANTTETSYSHDNLTCDSSHTYRVVAVNTDREALPSTSASATTDSCGSAPGAFILLAPAHEQMLRTPATQLFAWSPASGALKYQFTLYQLSNNVFCPVGIAPSGY